MRRESKRKTGYAVCLLQASLLSSLVGQYATTNLAAYAAGNNSAGTASRSVAALPAPTAAGESQASSEQKAFNELVDHYFDDSFKTSPNWATDVGIHEFDGNLTNWSAAAVSARAEQLKGYLEKFKAIDAAKLDSISQLDLQMLVANANAELLDIDVIKNWKRNPDMYSSAASSNIFSLIKRNFAPAQDRIKSVTAREKQIPELLKQAKANLENPPKIYTEIALQQLPGIIDFFEKSVPQAFTKVEDAELTSQFKSANSETVAALKDYQSWLKKDLLPKSKGEFALGKDLYLKKLLYEDMVDDSIESLRARGLEELKRLQTEFQTTAKEMDPSKTPEVLFASISSDHPRPNELITSVQGVLSDLKNMCTNKSIVTIPADEGLRVEESPPFLRALSFASMDTPGPFEQKAKEAFYNVTLPEKTWSQKKTEEHMRSFCKQDLLNTSVHEAYPGHYVQGLWMRLAPSKTRKLLYCGSNSEGWAHYCEEMMPEQGLGGGDKRLKMVQLHDALLRCCRYIVGIDMHTQGMTMDQGIAFFMKEGYQEKANAERETKRGTMDPTYCVYTLGKLQILSLKNDYKKDRGASYTLKEFHNNFLAQGCPPIKIVRQALLPVKPQTELK